MMNPGEMMRSVLDNSGLLTLWDAVAPWLALDERQLIFIIATPLFIAVALWEYLRIRHDPALMDGREAVRNFALGAGYQGTELLFAGIIAFPVYALCYRYRLLDLELTWVTGMCQNATNIFNGNWAFYLPLALLGFNPVWIGIAYALSLAYQFFIHTTLVKRLPRPIEWLFNTPGHHRVHHGRNPGYIDRNYGGTLIVWDRLFGSFVDEAANNPPRYGITRPVPARGLIALWTHEYRDLFQDMAHPGPLWARLSHLWRPPEWQRAAADQQLQGQRQPPR